MVLVLGACKKENGPSPEELARAEEFKSVLATKVFQIKDYYSDKPIDYVEDDDEIRAETNLWGYVSPWLKDDYNAFNFSTGKVAITQNAVKFPNDNSEVLIRNFSVGADADGAYFMFLTHEYEPLKYRIIEFSEDHFVIYVDWHSGARVITRFEAIVI